MQALLAVAIGVVVATAVYLLLSRDLPRMLIGFMLFSTAANLLMLLVGRIESITPAVIEPPATALVDGAANSLPQALILTAIVIGFGLTAFSLMLALRVYWRFRTLDAEALDVAEGIDPAVLPAEENENRS